jgi:hypothetical protein
MPLVDGPALLGLELGVPVEDEVRRPILAEGIDVSNPQLARRRGLH